MSADPVHFTRRDGLRFGALSLLTGAFAGPRNLLAATALAPARADAAIVVWLDGGASHLDTFDPKPEAPSEYRGEYESIASSLDGVRICEHLPRLAKALDKFALLRTLSSREGNHDRGSHHYMTGYKPSPAVTYPSIGSVMAKQVGLGESGVPSYVSLDQRPQFAGAGYLGARFDPFTTSTVPGGGDDRASVSLARLERRRQLRERLGGGDGLPDDLPLDSFYDQAFDLLTSETARSVFEIEREPAAVLDAYGRFPLGRACLTARRLVEAGSRFVTVHHPGWDTHVDNFRRLTFGYPGPLPSLDQALTALVTDLESRGRLERTLVLCLGEFGRTPKINASAGRDHWPRANCALLAGGGVRTGQVIGATDARGELPIERPVDPGELVSTVYHLLGMDRSAMYTTADGRRVRVLDPSLRPIEELL
ncbi:MAG: DUF1501 domain-containing protein [Planctomycetota bacterium]|jgi:hypothetical protein